MLTKPDWSFVPQGVSAATLRALATALRSGQLTVPVTSFAVSKVAACPEALAANLQQLGAEGMSTIHLALLLEASAATVEATLAAESLVELVWTGPELDASHRDTAVVLQELFAGATRSILVSTFVIQDGRHVLAPLAGCLDRCPELGATLFVHVGRARGDARDDSEVLREFAHELGHQWPGRRRPDVFYDPRTLSVDEDIRASWHAKCVVVDDRMSFVTSANFTDWAQQRNVEAGVLIRSVQFARQLQSQFDVLVRSGAVRRLPGF